MTRRHPKAMSAEGQPAPEPKDASPTEEVWIQSRVHRPLHFTVRGHGTIRLGAFEKVKLPAFALDAADLQALAAEGAITKIAPDQTQPEVPLRRRDDPVPRAEPTEDTPEDGF